MEFTLRDLQLAPASCCNSRAAAYVLDRVRGAEGGSRYGGFGHLQRSFLEVVMDSPERWIPCGIDR